MSSSNCCFLTCIQVSQEAGQAVWYSHLFQNFPQFIVIHTVKGFGTVNKAEIDVFLELSCFFKDPVNVGNLISGSSAFYKTSLNIWKFTVHILLKPNPPTNAVDLTSIPGSGRPLEAGIVTHSSILAWRVPMDRRAWWATVHRVTNSRTLLKWLSTHSHSLAYTLLFDENVYACFKFKIKICLNHFNFLVIVLKCVYVCMVKNVILKPELISLIFCDDFKGWDGGRRWKLKREELYIYTMTDSCCIAEVNITL